MMTIELTLIDNCYNNYVCDYDYYIIPIDITLQYSSHTKEYRPADQIASDLEWV